MYKIFTITFIFLFIFLPAFSENVSPDAFHLINKELNQANYNFSFEQNNGQLKDMNGHAVPNVFFKTEVAGLQIYITQKGLTYVFNQQKDSGI